MKRFAKALLVGGMLAGVVAAVILARPEPAYAPPPAQNVNVVNTPLPVEVTNPAPQSVQHKCVCVIPNLSQITTDTVTVPSGRRLVIEFVSVRAYLPTGQTPEVQIFTGTGGFPSGTTTSFGHWIALPVTPIPSGPDDFYHASQPVQLYADPGSSVTIHVARFQSSGTAVFEVGFSGHLVTLP